MQGYSQPGTAYGLALDDGYAECLRVCIIRVCPANQFDMAT